MARVLLVDDDKDLLDIFSELLLQYGYDVVPLHFTNKDSAANLAIALAEGGNYSAANGDTVSLHTIAAIIADMQVSHNEQALAVALAERVTTIPVIAHTANTDAKYQLKNSNVFSVLVKPVRLADCIEHVKNAIHAYEKSQVPTKETSVA